MSIYFVDTSALAKRYLPEVGSAWVQGWVDPASGHTTIISVLSTVEFIALLARRRREGSVSPIEFNRLQWDFIFHTLYQYQVIALHQEILDQAQYLVANHPLRTLDALQLASAQIVARTIEVIPIFVAADLKLLAIAAAEGFPTDNPNAHS